MLGVRCSTFRGEFSPFLILILLSTWSCFPGVAYGEKPTIENPILVKERSKEILIAGYVQGKEFNRKPLISFKSTKNWHAVVWEGGAVNRSEVLFVSHAKDHLVYDALVRLGATPGNNLSVDTWEKRGQNHHPEPNKKVAGASIEISVDWEGAPRTYLLSELMEDPGEKGFSFRFGGNKETAGHWESGCIVCMYSCPAGRISNAAYTANDYVFGATHFSAKENLLPPDGTQVIITISIR